MSPVTGSVPDLPPEPAPDVQAALTALAHRPPSEDGRTQPASGTGSSVAQATGSFGWLPMTSLPAGRITDPSWTGPSSGKRLWTMAHPSAMPAVWLSFELAGAVMAPMLAPLAFR